LGENKHDNDPDYTEGGDNNDNSDNDTIQRLTRSSPSNTSGTQTDVMSQSFRDAFACHLYMLYSAKSDMESEVKVNKGLELVLVCTCS
jgi:hypothetical protein